MKVLSGTARGVPLKVVPDFETRPILDRLKKSLFSMLDAASLLLDARVADLYAGTGTQGIEALSRGAEFCMFVEVRPEAVALMQENLAKTRLDKKAEIRRGRVEEVLRDLGRGTDKTKLFDLILYDPPFVFSREAESRAGIEKEMDLAAKILYPGHGRLVLRFEKKIDPPSPSALTLQRHWTDGPHAFAFYSVPKNDSL